MDGDYSKVDSSSDNLILEGVSGISPLSDQLMSDSTDKIQEVSEFDEKTKLDTTRDAKKNIDLSKLRNMIASKEVKRSILNLLTDQENVQF